MNSGDAGPGGKLLARTLHDGTGRPPQRDMVIEIAQGRFRRIAPWTRAEHGTGLAEHAIVTPGLIDIQINGANDVQFSDAPTVEALSQIAIGAERGGTAWILPTFVTAMGQGYVAAMDAARAAIEAGVPGILGLHLEGPFLSPRRPGIHQREAIRRIEPADIAALTAPFPGPLLVTLAPEEAPAGTVRQLTDRGVIVFAGHSEASFADMRAAERDGLRGATHLFNAMSQVLGREPGVAGSVLGSGSLYAGIIADGHHVHWNNVALALRLMPDRLCLVTDAMCTLAGTRQEFVMHGERILLADGRLTNAGGTLAGAHVAMDESIRNILCRELAPPAQVVRTASRNPAAALGLADHLGSVLPGQIATCSTFDEGWRATGVIRCPADPTGPAKRKYQQWK